MGTVQPCMSKAVGFIPGPVKQLQNAKFLIVKFILNLFIILSFNRYSSQQIYKQIAELGQGKAIQGSIKWFS